MDLTNDDFDKLNRSLEKEMFELIRPRVEARIREHFAKHPLKRRDKILANLAELVMADPDKSGLTNGRLFWFLLGQAYDSLRPIGKKEMEDDIVMASKVAAAMFLNSWLNILYSWARAHGGCLGPSLVNDDMLPKGVMYESFDQALDFGVDFDDAVLVLKEIRASLPHGDKLPSSILAYLINNGVRYEEPPDGVGPTVGDPADDDDDPDDGDPDDDPDEDPDDDPSEDDDSFRRRPPRGPRRGPRE